ncbi:rRNA maturation RNase YbeY [Sulfuricystis multivorans]|uniref:rRNA maturation RNase YbeY n=1 Tax=Sulfuricystis multivorans TaxID=2211108 RepID=UPI000F82836D|nr:rRNA maturation RNase YbeY [Sulfuricystis multivorans]
MKPELHLAVQYAVAGDDLPERAQVRRWVRAAQEKPATVTVRLCDDDEGRELNRAYRGKDYATNVLSFVYEDEPVVGDLVICLPVVRREAVEQGKALRDHLAHMVVHGMLHLQGYDHETNVRDAARMEAREREVLARFGIPDPYR